MPTIQNNTIEKKDEERFKKVSCSNILDLALNIPKKYENRYLNNEIILNQTQVINANIISIKKTAQTLQLRLSSINTKDIISCTVFNYKPFHFSIYKEKTSIFLLGKILINKASMLEISQPKVLKESEINKIYSKYSSIILKNLIAKYLNTKNLIAYGIKKEIAELIIEVHNPNIDFIKKYQTTNSIFNDPLKQNLDALKFIEIFNYYHKLKSKKHIFKSTIKLENNISSWISSLPFILTKDQLSCIQDIQKDFASKNASRRIIVGDVGSGKSIVIFASALMAYPNKVLLMAPTTILAKQLYEEAKKYIGSFLKIDLIESGKKDINDNTNLYIGTHSILYKDFKNISLIMIDEQHKFGSNQRQAIESFSKQDDKRAHFLQFSATPIPRTMAMIESSLIDFSFIKTTPFKKNIQTKQIFKKDFKQLLEHIQTQIKNNKQTIIVYPLVEESEKINYTSINEAKDFWINNFKNTYATFGADKNKEKTIQDFAQNGDILLATTLIEVGISLPKLSTIIIVGAERLGLASLHQLRGRVSRTGIKGYCFLYSNNPSSRLEKFSSISNGFDIAELDLQYRESGDIANGKKQSGKIFNFINLSEDIKIIQNAQKEINNY